MRTTGWRRTRRVRRWAAILALCLGVLAAPVRAQEEEDTGPFREPGIAYKESRRPYIQWLAGSLIIIACLLAGAKNPHRTHLD